MTLHDTGHGPSPAHRPHRRVSRRRIAVGTLLAAAIMGIGAYAAHGASAGTALVDRALSLEPSPQYIDQNGLGQTLNLANSACGFTVTVNRVYADANRVVIGYTISGPAGRTFIHQGFGTEPTLTNAQGTALPALAAASTAMDGNTSASYAAYDASGLAGTASTVALHFTIPSIMGLEQTGASPVSAACETYGVYAGASRGPGMRDVTMATPLAFDLTVPVDTRVREVDPHQAAQAGATRITLDRVVVTPSETRVYLSGMVLGSEALIVNGQDYAQTPGVLNGCAPSTAGANDLVCSFGAPLYDQHGDWTIVGRAALQAQNGGPYAYGDAATFHVTVP